MKQQVVVIGKDSEPWTCRIKDALAEVDVVCTYCQDPFEAAGILGQINYPAGLIVGSAAAIAACEGRLIMLAARIGWRCCVLAETSRATDVIHLLAQGYKNLDVSHHDDDILQFLDSSLAAQGGTDCVQPEYLASADEIAALLGVDADD
ncbi:hypothetical protein ACFL6U_11600 [Planctomycetota bacterium]